MDLEYALEVADRAASSLPMKTLAAEVRRQTAAVERVRELHRPWEWDNRYCAECVAPHDEDVPYPCPTVRALEGS